MAVAFPGSDLSLNSDSRFLKPNDFTHTDQFRSSEVGDVGNSSPTDPLILSSKKKKGSFAIASLMTWFQEAPSSSSLLDVPTDVSVGENKSTRNVLKYSHVNLR